LVWKTLREKHAGVGTLDTLTVSISGDFGEFSNETPMFHASVAMARTVQVPAIAFRSLAMNHRPTTVTAGSAADPVLDADIAVLELSLRTTNVLRVNQLHTVRDVTRVPAKKLFALSRLGRNSLREIVESVNQKGLRLAD
jgi:hypothetical protein